MRVRNAKHLNGLAISQAMQRLRQETGHFSNTNAVRRNANYQELLSGGEQVVRMLFKDMLEHYQNNRVNRLAWHSFTLIYEIMNDGPDIPFASRGRLNLITMHYLAWGKSLGLL
jgi:hypothetical protein